MEKDTKQPSWITWLVIVAIIAATVWHYSDARKSASELYEEGNVTTLLKRAEKGDVTAQFYLGLWFGDKKNDGTRALEWWQKASENGYALASYNIGKSYLEGKRGVEEDISLARQWLQKALAQGYGHAGLRLYLMDHSFTDLGGEYHSYIIQTQGKHAAEAIIKEAPKWLEQGIIRGDTDDFSLSLLSHAYTYRGYPMERAAELIPALHAMEKTQTLKELHNELLGMLYFAEQDYANAFTYLEKATENPLSRHITVYRLGRMYEEGLGVARDERKARDIYASVPLRDNGEEFGKDYRLILWHLAMMQAQGRGGDVDKENAAKRLAELEKFLAYDQQYEQPLQHIPSAEQMDALREAIAAP